MPADDIIIIGPGPKIKSNTDRESTIIALREAADALEAGEVDVQAVDEE